MTITEHIPFRHYDVYLKGYRGFDVRKSDDVIKKTLTAELRKFPNNILGRVRCGQTIFDIPAKYADDGVHPDLECLRLSWNCSLEQSISSNQHKCGI